jgi:glutathione S-transferase
MKIYGDLGSGNCLKVKYTADHLGLPYAWVHVDIMRGETRTPEFLARFPLGRIPAVEFEDGRRLAESSAIIRYLARGSALLPYDAFAQAKVDELMFWEQYSHEPYVATTRYHIVYLKRSLAERETWRVERGEAALDLMENTLLAGRDWLCGESMTIADIALLPYTRLAHEGGFDLASRRAVRAWIARCEHVLRLGPAQG